MHRSITISDIYLRWMVAVILIEKKYTELRPIAFNAANKSRQHIVYDEKDTAFEKILQRIAHISVDVRYFAGKLSNAPGNWREYVHTHSDPRFWLFFSNLLLGLIQSIFVTPV